jgi:hypothetical protein
MSLPDELAELNHMMQSELERYRARFGAFAFKMRQEQMGRSIAAGFWREGVESDLAPMVTLSPYVDAAYELYGRSPFTVDLEVSAEGVPAPPVFEFDRPPHALDLREPALYVQELEQRPRPPELVPGWMKVELAAVGAWDLRADVPTWKDFEPTGVPQTPESVGVSPPPGAEWALTNP